MWSDQILKVMLIDCTSASVLTGIYSIDTLPTHIEYPAALTVNLSPSTSTITHWTAIYTTTTLQDSNFNQDCS